MSDKTPQGNDRRYDCLKPLAVLLVVLGHITILYSPTSSLPQPDGNKWIHLLTDAIYSFHMPLFIFISGCIYAIGRKRQKYGKLNDLLRNKFRRLMIPYYFIGLFLLIPVLIVLQMTELNYTQSALHLFGGLQVKHLWFLIALFLMFPLVRLSEPLLDRVPPPVVLAGSIALALIAPMEKLQLLQIGMVVRFLPFFLLGYYTEKLSFGNVRLKGGGIGLLTLASGALFLFKLKGNLPPTAYLLTDYALAICCIALAMQLISYVRIDQGNRIFRLLLSTSFGIYLLHPMIIYALFRLKGDFPLSPVVMIPAVFVAALLLSIAGTVLLRKLHLRFGLGE